ncbi:beta-lactamase family protein [Paenibacillus pasadenensis]|uniref:serine hydrolase domain-containing protein n=1 Tax=Paenibacillus pasadenensis TaxID=217090 RepID=UPI00203DAE4B|nr:serine hydrolase domain-containing protein [Paenibacillus pasadenensis]MCM3749795.1 beta-lactamase family protein [Paenibacillus pasadenensis]
MTAPAAIYGHCSIRFRRLRDVFIANFQERGEVGAALCVYQGGEKAVDLWGGVARPADDAAWQANTLVCMFSVGKSLAVLCTLMLADRGVIGLDAPVARYWPEFARCGKSAITVRMLLGGLSGVLYADAAPDGAGLDWDVMIKAFERQVPAWVPGKGHAYHSMSLGYLLAELVYRADGRTFNRFLADEVTGPLGAEFAFGLNDEQISRCADIISNPANVSLSEMSNPNTPLGRAWRITPQLEGGVNNAEFRRGFLPSSNGHGTARAVAKIYAALSGQHIGKRLLSPQMIHLARQQMWNGIDAMTGNHYRYGLGFFLQGCPLVPLGPNNSTFGHPGLSGALAFADPLERLSFCYSPNFMAGGAGVGDRCEALVDALYRDIAAASSSV